MRFFKIWSVNGVSLSVVDMLPVECEDWEIVDKIEAAMSYDDINFSDDIDEIYGTVEICGISFSTGEILRLCDPVAFGCYFDDEKNRIAVDLKDRAREELKEIGDIVEGQGVQIELVDEKTEEERGEI